MGQTKPLDLSPGQEEEVWSMLNERDQMSLYVCLYPTKYDSLCWWGFVPILLPAKGQRKTRMPDLVLGKIGVRMEIRQYHLFLDQRQNPVLTVTNLVLSVAGSPSQMKFLRPISGIHVGPAWLQTSFSFPRQRLPLLWLYPFSEVRKPHPCLLFPPWP